MEIEFSHLLLLLLFCQAADDVLGTALLFVVATPGQLLLAVSGEPPFLPRKHARMGSQHSGLKSYHDGKFQPCRYRQSLSETADREAPVLVVMFKRLERMQWKRST